MTDSSEAFKDGREASDHSTDVGGAWSAEQRCACACRARAAGSRTRRASNANKGLQKGNARSNKRKAKRLPDKPQTRG